MAAASKSLGDISQPESATNASMTAGWKRDTRRSYRGTAP
jgi:hypothetical protein